MVISFYLYFQQKKTPMTDSRQLKFGINIPVNRINNFLKWVVGINIFFLIGTWLQAEKVIFPTNVTAQWWLVELNFAKENIAASWYSSMLLFSIGIVAALCFLADMQRTENWKGRMLNYGWLVMAGIFILLSFDEMGSFHEMIGSTPLFKKVGHGGSGGWYVFYALIAAVAVFMVSFFFLKFKENKFSFLLTIIAVLLFVSNPLQEKFEMSSWRNSPDPDNWHRPIFYLLLEEGSEIFASFCFLFSFVTYAIKATSVNNKILQLESAVSKNFIVWLIGLACLLGLMMWLIRHNAWNIPGDDDGVPQDWPPAATAFATFAAAFYLYFKKNVSGSSYVYLSIGLVSIFTSLYFGGYLYGYHEGPFVNTPYFLLAVTTVTGIAAVLVLKGVAAKLFFIAWVALIALPVFAKNFSPTVYGYAASVCLMLGLFLHYKSLYEPVDKA